MNPDAATVLVIIVSVVLLILLLLSITLVIILIQIFSSVRRRSTKAELTADNINEMVNMSGKKIVPAMISALVAVATRGVKERSKKRNKD